MRNSSTANTTTGKLDWTTILIYLFLVFFGWLNIYAAVYNEAHANIFDISQRYGMQMIWIVAAFTIAAVIMLLDTRLFYAFSEIFYGITIVLLLLVLVAGKEVNGQRCWFELGGLRIQPAEFAKVSTVLLLARVMSSYNFVLNSLRGYLLVAAVLLPPLVLIKLQPDAGSMLVYGSLLFLLYKEGMPGWVLSVTLSAVALFIFSLLFDKLYMVMAIAVMALAVAGYAYRRTKTSVFLGVLIAGLSGGGYYLTRLLGAEVELYYFVAGATVLVALVMLVVSFAKHIKRLWMVIVILVASIGINYSVDYVFHKVLALHQQKRINDLLGIESDPLGWGYNVNQSKIAIGSGGLVGKGFLQGTQTKYNFVPEQSTDFIFCTIGEEWGFVGSVVIVGLFTLLLFRIMLIADRQREAFARIFGYGVLSIFFFHFAINIGMTIGLAPVVGIPLPFISYGGSSLWSFTMLLFILLKFDASRFE
ncbi:rod shape-determining protein RodA [uncultured Acetobacteroides sp.]|uniref:rod shape-determining protein RodA n=1 Tax=uncultured Acetobacteroides sp. TaxID=1760811 RepID=UPI0029F58D25|nr:rod shape-determining protein RodA [uncultured Acetobacteroides sp.]